MSIHWRGSLCMGRVNSFLGGFSTILLFTVACARYHAILPSTKSSAPTGTINSTSTSTNPLATALPIGETTRTLIHDGLKRSYILHLPPTARPDRQIPVVFVLHGGMGNAEGAIRMSGFNEIADQNGFAVVYPNGSGRLNDEKVLTWNGGNCCAYAQENNVDDVGFLRAIVVALQDWMSIDSKRIFATGMSNGGILAQRLGCEAADLFAAIAPVSGTLNYSPCTPTQPISVIEFHGNADRHIPYEGGIGPESLVNVDFASVHDSIIFWATDNYCDLKPQTVTVQEIRHDAWTGCAGSASVELYTILGGGHAWPGGVRGWAGSDHPTKAISASQLIWQFFESHPKQ
jgi:polyhydroxybutyrate depolymerase